MNRSCVGLLLGVFFLTACGGGSSSPAPRTATRGAEPLQGPNLITPPRTIGISPKWGVKIVDHPPLPFNPRVDVAVKPTRIVPPVIPLEGQAQIFHAWMKRSPKSNHRAVRNDTSGQDTGGQTGWFLYLYASANTGGIEANEVAYLPSVLGGPLSLNTPAQGTTSNILYAPTMKGPNGNCLEVTTAYANGTVAAPMSTTRGSTNGQLEFYDFCKNGGTFSNSTLPIDSYFQDNYLRVYSGSSISDPAYLTETLQYSDGTWHALVYNYGATQWVDYYASAAATDPVNGNNGWIMFETHYGLSTDPYTPQPCSSLPDIASFGVSVLQTDGSWYDPGSDQLETYQQAYGNRARDCFPESGTTSPYYSENYDVGQGNWWVISN